MKIRKKMLVGGMAAALVGTTMLTGCWSTRLISEDAGQAETSAESAASEETPESEEDVIQGMILPEDEVQSTDVTMVFSGDIMPSDYVLQNYDSAGISGIIDDTLLAEMKEADICMVNEEFPFGTSGTPAEDKQYTFQVNPSYVSLLQDLGVDIVTLANNHTLDYGTESLLETFDVLDKASIPYVGAGESLERASDWETFEENGRSIAVLSASRVIPEISWDVRNQQPGVFTTYDPEILVSQIQAAKEECDFVAVYVHWGIEKNEYPEDYQRELAQAYIDAGADLVIGSHPHVLQGIEYYKGVPIVYSLGNYMFYDKIEKTALAKVVWDADGNLSLQIIPASASGAKTSVCTDEAADEILQYLESISTGIEIDDDGFVSEN